jgi:hypothetical protein
MSSPETGERGFTAISSYFRSLPSYVGGVGDDLFRFHAPAVRTFRGRRQGVAVVIMGRFKASDKLRFNASRRPLPYRRG